jgi:hypothetical protein
MGILDWFKGKSPESWLSRSELVELNREAAEADDFLKQYLRERGRYSK